MALDWPSSVPNLTVWFPEYFKPDLPLYAAFTTTTGLPARRTTKFGTTHKPSHRPKPTSHRPHHTTHRHPHHTTHKPHHTSHRPHHTTKRPHHTTKRPHHTTHRPHHTTHRPHHTTHRPHHTTHRPHHTTHRPHHTTHRPHHTTHHNPHHTTHHHFPLPTHPTGEEMEEFTEPMTVSTETPEVYDYEMTWDDATWILINSFMIFTMQTGFGLLESGVVSVKNQTNIMMKNVVDIIFGGFSYWLFGFSLSFGTDPGSNPFVGVGEYVVDANYDKLGPVMVQFLFQLSFATTSTTIVSGTIAERFNFKAYCIFSFLNTIVYSIPARWVWGPTGWLAAMGCIDIAGSGAVHLLGGASGYVAAWMVGPRLGRYDKKGKDAPPLSNPVSCIVGLYILWWGWLAFNSGSTFGVTGDLWKFAGRASVATIMASIGGGLVGSFWGFCRPSGIFPVMDIVNPVLGGLVGVTAGCALYHTQDALAVGAIGGLVTLITSGFADLTRVDDPVGATSVHGFAGIWGLLAVGFFADKDDKGAFSRGYSGLFRRGSAYLLGVQALASVCIIAWAMICTFLQLFIINLIIPIRMEAHEELLGADLVEHGFYQKDAGITPIMSAFGSNEHIQKIKNRSVVIGRNNPTHDLILHAINEINVRRRWRRLGIISIAFSNISSKIKTFVSGGGTTTKFRGNKIQHYDDFNFEGNSYEVTDNNNPEHFELPWHYRDSLGEPDVPKKY